MPIPRRCVGTPSRERPRSRTEPATIGSRPTRHRSSVVFPLPFGPIRTTNSCSATSRSTPRSTGAAPQVATRPRTSRHSELDTPPTPDDQDERHEAHHDEEPGRRRGEPPEPDLLEPVEFDGERVKRRG